ncbi:BON domain-containing protein [Aestuariicella hydrocarbonica]|uniref:BON domain-containing protein n=1 Tax=Pseudomaricurvus hydrocarbonicus TaxID=1470433 RepID=A0A9E5JTK8_9GAMM|nr:BON domain-containing protein [Aestuariicella hydrocarbonica]NHO65059.1 BON domain-containing protein [Aestuariicella hydrocarbonica]
MMFTTRRLSTARLSTAIRWGLAALLLATAGCTTIVDATTDAPIQLNPGKRTLGAMIDDEQLETVAVVNINKASPYLKQANIDVVAFNSILLLTGQVASNDLRMLAGETAKKIHGVRQVFNEIQVQGTTSILARTNDTWLTTKVKSVLLANQDVDSSRIKVVTEDGVVYLLGLLSRAEANRAAETVSTIGGVQKVVKAVEYIN